MEWTIFCGGAYGGKGASTAPVILSSSGIQTRFTEKLDFESGGYTITNNIAKYEALVLALRKMKALGQPRFVVKTDSKVITYQAEKNKRSSKPRASPIPRRSKRNGKVLKRDSQSPISHETSWRGR